MILVSVDCGVRGCGVAVFDGAKLSTATYVKNPQRHGQGANSALAMAQAVKQWFCQGCSPYFKHSPDELAIETMRVYEASEQKGDQNDLLGVQLVAGAITGIMGCPVVSYVPQEWKGSVDGDVFTKRIISRLSETEKQAITYVSESVDHNTIDGVGVGLKRLGRLDAHRVYARE